MKYFVLLFCVTTLVVEHANAANILVIAIFSRKSHTLTYLPLIEELGERGHNVTMVTPTKPIKEMKNVKQIYTIDVEKIIQANDLDAFELKQKQQTIDFGKAIQMIHDTCIQSYDLPQVQSLLNENFDLVFLQPIFNDCLLGLIYRLQAPMVLFTPTVIPSMLVDKLGGNFPSSLNPNFILGYSNPMSFMERFKNFGVDVMATAYWSFVYEPKMEKIYRERLGNDIPSINEIVANQTSLVLSNGHFSLHGPNPYYPDVIDVGGIHSKPAKPIPNDLENFISKGKDGFILFSMGSTIVGDMMPNSKRKLFLNVFSKLKQQVIWKWESETMPDLPSNVKLSKWLPQQDLLGHKDIKMFITHCGGGSTEEAIYHGVPMVGLPMTADQPQNSRLAKEKGCLVELDWSNLTETDFAGAINEILNNPKYRNNVKTLSALFKDRPQDPLELGIYWIEYVLRHKGALHLRSIGRKLNRIQYHSIDVICAYAALIFLGLYLVFYILGFILRKVLSCCGFSKSSSLINRKKTN